ncbi:hypothetical protein B0H14DRAFT_3540637 [Mycena olivaceomarginata]|nr:hypothetical protein B0H14DRAFT_3540637 [Mycena olivaceomarginata]
MFVTLTFSRLLVPRNECVLFPIAHVCFAHFVLPLVSSECDVRAFPQSPMFVCSLFLAFSF